MDINKKSYRKIDFLNYLDNPIADAFESAILMYTHGSVGYYQFLQRYCELLIKDFVQTYEYSYEVEKKATLGILIGNDTLKDLLIDKIGLNDDQIEDISIINQTSNSLKHNNEEIMFHSDIAFREFNTCFMIAKKYLQISKKYNIGSFNIREYIKVEQEKSRSVIETNKDFNTNKDILNSIENNIVETSKSDDLINNEKKTLLSDNFDSNKIEFKGNLNSKVNFINLNGNRKRNVEWTNIEKLITTNIHYLRNNKAYYSMENIDYYKMIIRLILLILEFPKKTGKEYTSLLVKDGIKVSSGMINSLLYSASTLFNPTFDNNQKPSWDLSDYAYNLLLIDKMSK